MTKTFFWLSPGSDPMVTRQSKVTWPPEVIPSGHSATSPEVAARGGWPGLDLQRQPSLLISPHAVVVGADRSSFKPSQVSRTSQHRVLSFKPARVSRTSQHRVLSFKPAQDSRTSQHRVLSFKPARVSRTSQHRVLSFKPARVSLTSQHRVLSFKPARVSLTSQHRVLLFFPLHQPPASCKNKLRESLILSRVPNLLAHCDSPPSLRCILGNFGFHQPHNAST